MIAATFCVVIYSGTLYIISLGFLNLCFVISNLSPNPMLIAELSVFISSSLPFSISIPLPLIVLTALIPALMSVGLMFLFSWILMCSGERASSFGVSVLLYIFSSFFTASENSFLHRLQMVAQLHSNFLETAACGPEMTPLV